VNSDTATPEPALRRRIAESLLLPAAIGIWWCVAVVSTLGKSATFDEPCHICGGVMYWQLNDCRLQPENPKLPQRWSAIPLALAGWPFPSFDHPAWVANDMAALYRDYLFEAGKPTRLMLALARSFAAVWGVLSALVVFFWSRELFGREAAWLSLAFCLFDTTLLAHAPLATSDACAAFFFSWSTWSLWRMLQMPSPSQAIVASAAVAGLFLAKFSAPLEIWVGFILLSIRTCCGPQWEVSWNGVRRRVSAASGLAAVLACLAVIGFAVWLALWLTYGWRFEAIALEGMPDVPRGFFSNLKEAVQAVGGFKGRLLGLVGEYRLLPESFLYGMACVLGTMFRQAFLFGHYSIAGWKIYFPVAFLVKTPLPTLVAIALVPLLAFWPGRGPIGSASKSGARSAGWYSLTPVFALLFVYWSTSCMATINIGHRHILPVYPATFVLLGALPGLSKPSARLRWLPWILAAWAGVTCLSAFPNYLAFFNGLVRRDEGWKCLVDSNLDWGQEHYTLEDFVTKERRLRGPEYRIYGCLFDQTPQGTGDGAVTLLPTVMNDVDMPSLEPGTYCLSATHLQGVYLRLFGPWTARREERFQDRLQAVALLSPLSPEQRQQQHDIAPDFFARIVEDLRQLEYHRLLAKLRERQPDVVLNGAILVYRLDPETFEVLIRGEQPMQATRFPGSDRDD